MKKGILMVTLLMAPFFVISQSFDVSVSSDSILIGNYIELKFTAENIDGQFESPDLSDFVIVSGPNQSSSIQMINSKTTSQRSWSYYVEPSREGEIIIPPAYLVYDEETYETEPQVINIYANPDGIIIKPKSNNSFFESFSFPHFGQPRQPQVPEPPKPPTQKSNRKVKRI